MQLVLIILTVLVSILLIFVVLIQKSKGGGLASNFSSNNQLMGVRRTNSFIEKTTWTLAALVVVFSIAASWVGHTTAGAKYSVAPEQAETTQAADFNTEAAQAPVAPVQAD